jgi:hypothetical protein
VGATLCDNRVDDFGKVDAKRFLKERNPNSACNKRNLVRNYFYVVGLITGIPQSMAKISILYFG